MKFLKSLSIILVLSGCSGDEDGDKLEGEMGIWAQDSERVVIVQDNGNVMNSDERYVTYDYSRDTLTVEAKEILPTIYPVITGLTCIEDGATYEITITNGSGLDETYYSSNRACNNTEGMRFLKTSEISSLIPKLFTY